MRAPEAKNTPAVCPDVDASGSEGKDRNPSRKQNPMTDVTAVHPHPVPEPHGALRARRAASFRCAPLACGRRDPLDPFRNTKPSAFGLTEAELRAEANRLAGLGWPVAEITARLAIVPRPQAAA
jgi:hypothetical protein